MAFSFSLELHWLDIQTDSASASQLERLSRKKMLRFTYFGGRSRQTCFVPTVRRDRPQPPK
jgi:hypothetical protein